MSNIGVQPVLFIGSGAPAGFASPHQFYVDTGTGDLYDSLAGAWHKVSGGGGGGGGVNVQAGDYTADATDDGKIVVMTKATAKTLTLPPTPPSSTWKIFIQNAGAGDLTVDRNGLTIDGAASNLTLVQGEGFYLSTDGSNYDTERGFPPIMVGDAGAGGKSGLAPAPAAGDAAAGKFLKADASYAVPPGTGVPTSRRVDTSLPLTGGGDLSGDRTLNVNDFGGDVGAGGTKGTVPAPGAGDAAAGKFLKADGTWAAVASSAGRGDVNFTTGAIAAGAQATGTVTLGKSSEVYKTVTDGLCRIRFYSTAAERTADLSRAVNVKAPWNSGLQMELYLDLVSLETFWTQPPALVRNGDGPVVTTIYWTVDSLEPSGSHDFSITVTRLPIEV